MSEKHRLPLTIDFIQSLREDDGPCKSMPGTNVLVVEDDSNDALLMKFALEEIECRVDIARDGQQAANMLRSSPGKYCLMFLDINLPIMDGFAVLKIVNDIAPNLHVIIVTGGNRIDEIPRDRYVGLIRKPLHSKLAIEILNKTK